ncbi:MAG: DUF1731 domain-containing protein [Chitinophagaceae bacterium]
MKHKKIIIAGGTGFIGQALAKYFGKENHVIILSRQSVNAHNNNYGKELVKAADGYNITYWRWDGKNVEKHWLNDLEAADIVINLAGKSVNCRYHEKQMAEIINSRTDATNTLGEAIRQTIAPPKLWINATSATIYRNATDKPQDEITGEISPWKKDNMPRNFIDDCRRRWKRFLALVEHGANSKEYREPDLDFSIKVCHAWENAFFNQRTPFTRKVALRTAITLGEGGVIVPYFNLLKFGLGGHQGNGKQMYSWVHVEDFCRTVEWCFEHHDMEGIYNCAAPAPVTNNVFMATLRKATGHKFGLPAPAAMLEVGTALIRSETELILKSRWVLPAKLLQTGFRFKYNKLEDALTEIVHNTPRSRYHLF